MTPEPALLEDPACRLDSRQCEELLGPIFVRSCGAMDPEDRLLLQLLVLDGVPQKDVARSLGLNSGTVTRRRQHAAEGLLHRAHRLAAECPRPRQADDCLQLLLVGDDPELRARLADVLARGVRQAGDL